MKTIEPTQDFAVMRTVGVEEANFGIDQSYNDNLTPIDARGSWEMMMAAVADQELGRHHDTTKIAAKAVINLAMGGVEVADCLEQSGADTVEFVKKYIGAYADVVSKEYAPQIKEIDDFKSEFISIIDIAGMNGLPLDQEKSKKVLAKTKVRPMDSAAYFDKIIAYGAADGYNQRRLGSISIAPNLIEQTPSERRKFVYHELLHSLTGGVALKNGLEQILFFQGMKLDGASGLAEEDSKDRRLNIDEAVINVLANILANAQETGNMPDFTNMTVEQFFANVNTEADSKHQYDQQEHILKKIYSSIPESEKPIQKLLAMQFEYYDPSKNSGQRAPARKEFWRTVSKYTDINGVDKKMRESIRDGDPLLKSAHGYVKSEEHDRYIRDRAEVRSRARIRHDHADANTDESRGFKRNTHFREAIKERLQQTNAQIVNQEIQALKDQGMSSKQIRKHLSKQWHPDGGTDPNDEKIKLLNDTIDRKKQEEAAASAPHQDSSTESAGTSTPHDGLVPLLGIGMQSW